MLSFEFIQFVQISAGNKKNNKTLNGYINKKMILLGHKINKKTKIVKITSVAERIILAKNFQKQKKIVKIKLVAQIIMLATIFHKQK